MIFVFFNRISCAKNKYHLKKLDMCCNIYVSASKRTQNVELFIQTQNFEFEKIKDGFFKLKLLVPIVALYNSKCYIKCKNRFKLAYTAIYTTKQYFSERYKFSFKNKSYLCQNGVINYNSFLL